MNDYSDILEQIDALNLKLDRIENDMKELSERRRRQAQRKTEPETAGDGATLEDIQKL